MRLQRVSKVVSVAVVAALALGACGGGSNNADSAATSTSITANGTEPQNPLLPANTNEVGGGRIMDLLFEGLLSYDADGKTVNEIAESIETTDSQNYTITLKDGKTFTNGEPVTASSFVDAWNFGAAAKNAQLNSYFFESIKGYDEVSAEGATTETMSGLNVVDEKTFTVELSQPESDWPLRLGYTAFYPLPAKAFEDPAAFGENPVGNGPYMLAGDNAWQHEVQIDLVANPDYTGTRVPQNTGVTFKFYSSYDAAYADLQADNLDVLDQMPAAAQKTFKSDLGEGRYSEKPTAQNQTITIPQYLEEFSGEAGALRRQAISMAVNREEITDVIFSGARQPANDFTSPVIEGFNAELPGSEVLAYNPERAKELWDQAEAISPWPEGKAFTIGYNADGDHKEWVDAVCNSLKNNLGVDAQGKAYSTFKELRSDATAKTLSGAIRTGWQADYPSLYNFLGPLYATGAGSNDGDYTSQTFDDLLAAGLSAATAEEGAAIFNQAQEVLLKDLPVIPLWYQVSQTGWSNNVTDVETGWNGVPVYYNIARK